HPAESDRRRRLDEPGGGRDGDEAATAPLAAPSTVGFPLPSHSAAIHERAAAAVAVLVATKALVASAFAPTALPALKPNQPTQRSAAPVTVNGRLCGGIGSLLKPRRLPITVAQTTADIPELMCTTVPA